MFSIFLLFILLVYVGWEVEGLFLETASQMRVRRCFMFVPRDTSERFFFSDCHVLQGDCLKSLSFTVFRHGDFFLTFLEGTQTISSFDSLACAIGDTASAADLLYPL